MKEKIIIPYTSIEVSRKGFGTASLHHLLSVRQRQDLIAKAFDGGITHFDTAPYYGYGLAEYELGKFLTGRRSALTVTTKVGLYPFGPESFHISSVLFRKAFGYVFPILSLPTVNLSVARARKSLRDSLKRLKSDYVDFLLLHEPDISLLDSDETLYWLEQEHRNGLIRSWGVSGHRDCISPFLKKSHPIAAVLQTKDSLNRNEADFILDAGRSLQFTYGYLSSLISYGISDSTSNVISKAFRRNTNGCILFSTRSKKHLHQITQAID